MTDKTLPQIVLFTLLLSALANQIKACQLPPTWAGKWYQANKDPIRISNTEISDKGICRDKKGDKYLFEYTKQAHQTCLICLVLNERHINVLQYKESSCQPVPAQYLNRTTNSQFIIDNDHSLLDSICSDITGDAQLESLFRLETPSIECPISGKYHFTYDNCHEPKSSLDSCIDKKQLQFKFSACPDVPGSESKCEYRSHSSIQVARRWPLNSASSTSIFSFPHATTISPATRVSAVARALWHRSTTNQSSLNLFCFLLHHRRSTQVLCRLE
jgi:hypothetical protein